MPELEHLAQAVENLAIQNEALRIDVKALRKDTNKKVRAVINSTLVVGAVGLIAAIAAITSLLVFRSFKHDINNRSISSCNNFNADRLEQRNGLKNLIRGITPADQQANPQTQIGFSVFDAYVDNGWRFRDCSVEGIKEFQLNDHTPDVNCKSDGKGFCTEAPPLTIPVTPTTIGAK